VTRTPLSRSKRQRSGSPGRFTHRGVYALGSCSCHRRNVITLRSGAVGSAARCAHRGRRGAPHIVEAPAQLVSNGNTVKTLSKAVTTNLYQFLPRDAMRKRGLCCRPVPVRLSVTFLYCIQTAKDIVKLLSWPHSPIILVFLTPSAGTQFQREPIQRGRKIHG